MLDNKKGQTGGLITGLVMGIAGLVIAVIIAFTIVQTIGTADLLDAGEVTTTTINETSAWLNTTAYPLANIGGAEISGYTLTAIWTKDTGDYNVTVPLANATTTTAGYVTNASVVTHDNVSYTYTYVTLTDEEFTTDLLRSNYTEGVDNISGKIPTVLLISAIVLILAVMVLLVGAWKRMQLGGGDI